MPLLEVVVSLALSSMLVAVLIRMAFAIWIGTDTVRRQSESWAMSNSVDRMLGEHCHSASRASVSGGKSALHGWTGSRFVTSQTVPDSWFNLLQPEVPRWSLQAGHWQAKVEDGRAVDIVVHVHIRYHV